MGALPRLKKKVEFRYRKGSTNESQNCKFCIRFIPEFRIKVPRGERIENRCLLIGALEGARYRVRPDYTCDAQKFNGIDFSKASSCR